MKILRWLFIGVVTVALIADPVYGEPGKGQGKGQGRGNQGQIRGKSASHAATPEGRKDIIHRGRKDEKIRANRPDDQGTKIGHAAKIDRGRSADHRQIKEAKVHVKGFLNALEKARWSYNPNDERGQGNMGKPKMRTPYGFDKDSGREGSERGRAIHGPSLSELLTQGELLSIDFTMVDYQIYRLQKLLEEAIEEGNASRIALFTFLINHWTANPTPYNWIMPQNADETINYALTFPDGFDGETLLVTTTLTSIYDYFDVLGGAVGGSTRYAAGDVIMEETQEVVLGEDNTYSYSYDPPITLAGWGQLDADLAVTVTEPESGASYTMNYDRYIILWRCPYGKVSDSKTGTPIVGARVTVHYEDGSIVALDKASNSTASNPQSTDVTGRYGFKLETNRKYYLTASASGYKDYKSTVFTEKWHVLREDIALTPVDVDERMALK